ncbi:MAG TPA: ADOP family duplicated permease [Gemmatimonadaceae bacterium]|nr:ADOP family duplicated permease [Gemmatimonadaceae bacterium]
MTNLLHRLARRVRALTRPDTLDRDVDAEMRLHIELEAADLAHRHGLSPAEAHRRAAVAFGGVDRHAEEHRDARGVRWIEDFGQDVRYAARSLRRSPGFTVTAILVLALGIGASTAVFSAVDQILVSRLPYPNDDRIVRIYQQNSPTNRFGLGTVEHDAIIAQQRSFTAVGGARWRSATVAVGPNVHGTSVAPVTPGFFSVLGVRAERGRVIIAGDEAPDRLVATVTHTFATREFGGDGSGALGKPLTLDGVTYTIVGVLAAGVDDLAGLRAEVWTPLRLEPPKRRGPFGMLVIARLRDGVTLESAARDLGGVTERIFPLWASSFQDRKARLTPYSLRETMLGKAGETLALFGGAVALVLLIAIANVASLTLVRVTARTREAVLRTVLGASTTRVTRLLVTESLVLSALGALAGALLAPLLLRALVAVGPPIPRLSGVGIDVRAIGFAALLAVVTGVLVGLYPALSLLGRDFSGALRSGDREIGASRSTHLLRGGLVTAQFALALPLLATAALLLNSFVRLQRVDAGFEPRSLSYVRVALPVARYGPAEATAFWKRAIARLGEQPGVAAVGINQAMPPDDPADINNFDLVDRPVPPGDAQPTAPYMAASNGFFAAAGVRLLEGRLFTESDTGTGPPVMVVSRSWVRHYSADRPAVGRQLQGGGCTTCPPFTIVGVVDDVKYQGLTGNGEAMYVAPEQNPSASNIVFFRTAPGVIDPVSRARDVVRALDPSLALDDAGGLEERVYASVAPQRHWATLLGGFAGAALTLAAIGIFGMLSYLVAARRREIGVRVALGASRRGVIGMVVGRGMAYAIPGAVLGLLVSLVVRRRLEAVLFDIGGADPGTLVAAMVVFLVVALVASLLPARRAANVSPMEAMREG